MTELINFKEKSKETKEKNTPENGLDILVARGEWESLKDSSEFQSLSIEGKVVKARETLTNRITQVEDVFYDVARDNPRASESVLNRLKYLRNIKQAAGVYLAEVTKQNPKQLDKKAA